MLEVGDRIVGRRTGSVCQIRAGLCAVRQFRVFHPRRRDWPACELQPERMSANSVAAPSLPVRRCGRAEKGVSPIGPVFSSLIHSAFSASATTLEIPKIHPAEPVNSTSHAGASVPPTLLPCMPARGRRGEGGHTALDINTESRGLCRA